MKPTKSDKKYLPFVLAVVDGWGVAKKIDKKGDPTLKAKLPFLREVIKNYPQALLGAHGKYVGLPVTQDGNSEAGHLNLGAGRIVDQDSTVVSKSIKNGSFFKNPALLQAIKHAKKNNSAIHVMGLLSNYNSGHSSPDHYKAILKMLHSHGIHKIFIHFFTDGRDSPRYDAIKFLQEAKKSFRNHEVVASITGRLYAMDRKKEWSRTEMTYRLLTEGVGLKDDSPEAAIRHAYNRGETDEFIKPTIICDKKDKPVGLVQDNDVIIFFNLRSDRARQLTKTFVQTRFEQANTKSFKRRKIIDNLCFVALTDYGPDLGNVLTAYTSLDLKETLPFALKSLNQLYVAESEKFAHMTFFFNGGYDHSVAGEERFMAPSPSVDSYDLTPAMAARATTKRVLAAIKDGGYDFIAINYANADMVGHTGNTQACVKALEVIDECLGKIGRAIKRKHGTLMITADHGNVEETLNHTTGEVDTEHSKNPVYCLLYNENWQGKKFKRRTGILADVAPTILDLLNIPKPKEMTRRSLL